MVLKVQTRLGTSSVDVFSKETFSIEGDVKNSSSYRIPILANYILTNEADDEIVFLTPPQSTVPGIILEDDIPIFPGETIVYAPPGPGFVEAISFKKIAMIGQQFPFKLLAYPYTQAFTPTTRDYLALLIPYTGIFTGMGNNSHINFFAIQNRDIVNRGYPNLQKFAFPEGIRSEIRIMSLLVPPCSPGKNVQVVINGQKLPSPVDILS
jgi:hypothetical protein